MVDVEGSLQASSTVSVLTKTTEAHTVTQIACDSSPDDISPEQEILSAQHQFITII